VIAAATILGILYAVVCILLASVHSSRIGRVTLLDWSLLAIGGMYGIGWLLVLHVTHAGGNPNWAPWILPYENLYLSHSLGSLLLLCGILVGWYLSASIIRGRPIHNSVAGSRKFYHWSKAFWLLLVLAVITQGLYAHAYGGYIGQLEYSALIRSSLFDAVPHNPFSFLRPFGGFAMIATFGFFGLWLSRQRNLSIYLGFLLSFAVSVFILYSWLGRMGFLVFLTAFPLAIAMARGRSPHRLIMWGGVAFVGLLIGAYGVSVSLNLKAESNLLEFLARELSFPFGSFFAQIDHGEHLYRGFVDFMLAPMYLLPSSWWTHWIFPVGQVNTEVIMGAPKGEAGVTGAIPVDLVTLGLMQFHLPGVLSVGVLFGALLMILHRLLERVPQNGVRAIFEANIALKIAILGVFYAQPDLIISGNIDWIAATVLLFILARLPTIRVFPPSIFDRRVKVT